MAQGMRHGIVAFVPKICGKELEKEGAAWMDAKWIFPILSLFGGEEVSIYERMERTHESLNPKVAFAWLRVICRDIFEMLR